ncbi:ComEC/Rec2 family competence protein [Thalassospira australica]|uniref:ComEC/Rec2 family competence protein n=1 Tax=Thalassospira australica TaxID=1528106 RepID=UPI00384FA179
MILSLSGLWISRRWVSAFFGFLLLAGFCAGLLVASLHLETAASGLPAKTLYMTEIEGDITLLEPRGGRMRMTVAPVRIDGLNHRRFDWKVRLSLPGGDDLAVGDRIVASARLFPLRAPSVPGDPDFSRRLYLDGIGATGFVFGHQYRVTRAANAGFLQPLSERIEYLRLAIMGEIDRVLAWPESGIAKALIVGERGDVGEETADDLRKSGLAHLLAISGLHMGLLSGTVFFFLRFGLAAIPVVALRFPIKKWAAIGAMIAGVIYLGLSGASVPTQRAFITLMIVWVALLLDRRAISLRLVAVAALVVLILRPDAVLGPSFQLSFAAVAVLVAFYDGPGRRWFDASGDRTRLFRLWLFFAGLVITGILVTAVTAPIIGFHFGRISMVGVLSNLIAIPVMAFWIMPLIVATLVLMPFGAGALPLWLMKPGLTLLIETAGLAADQAWGLWHVEQFSAVFAAGMMVAIAWVLIWRQNRVVWLGVIPLCIAIAAQILYRPADILVSGDQESWAIRDREADKLILPAGISGFQQSVWMARYGIADHDAGNVVEKCDGAVCRATVGGKRIVVANGLVNPFYACRHADIIVSLKRDMPRDICPSDVTIIDDDLLWWRGGVSVALRPDADPVIETVRETSGTWPWIIIGGRVVK